MELSSKFGKWSPVFYGQLPFIFAYATSGIKIQYVKFVPLLLFLFHPPFSNIY